MFLQAYIEKQKLTKRYYDDEIEFIKKKYFEVRKYGKYRTGSDGQFTGGYSSEIYEYDGKKYDFGFLPEGTLDSLVVSPLDIIFISSEDKYSENA